MSRATTSRARGRDKPDNNTVLRTRNQQDHSLAPRKRRCAIRPDQTHPFHTRTVAGTSAAGSPEHDFKRFLSFPTWLDSDGLTKEPSLLILFTTGPPYLSVGFLALMTSLRSLPILYDSFLDLHALDSASPLVWIYEIGIGEPYLPNPVRQPFSQRDKSQSQANTTEAQNKGKMKTRNEARRICPAYCTLAGDSLYVLWLDIECGEYQLTSRFTGIPAPLVTLRSSIPLPSQMHYRVPRAAWKPPIGDKGGARRRQPPSPLFSLLSTLPSHHIFTPCCRL